MIVSISYDLKQPHRDYSKVISAIKDMGAWCKPLESYWIVDTNLTVGQVRDQVQGAVDGNDSVFCVRLQNNWGSYNIPQACVDWLNSPERRW
jgi:hypothetical protein